jgi:hypothetical protein
MAYTSKLKEWGATSEERVEFPDGYRYTNQNPPVAEYDNFLIHNVIKDVLHLLDKTSGANGLTVADADKVDGKHADELGGFKHVQSAYPDSTSEGSSWLKISNGLMFTSDGIDWNIQPAVGYQETNNLPNDTDVKVIHESPTPRTQTVDGSIELIDERIVLDYENGIQTEDYNWLINGDTGNLSAQSTTVLEGTQSGELVAAGVDTSFSLTHKDGVAQDVEFTIQIENDTANASDFSRVEFYDDTGASLGYLQFNDGAGNIVWNDGTSDTEIQASWTLGTTYGVELDPDLSAGTAELTFNGTTTSVGLAATPTYIKRIQFRNNTSNAATTRSIYLDGHNIGAREYGEALLEFNPPDKRIESWDILRFNTTPNGETVEVDVEDESGTSLISGATDPDDLSGLSKDTNLRFRVKLSRQDVANNPTFDYLYRRFTKRPGDTDLSESEHAKLRRKRRRNGFMSTRLATR